MREIKFRAWDKEEEIMFNVGAIAWSHNVFNTSNYVFGSNPHCYENKCQSPKHLNEECKFMQYTGLKDKNGKEIYEGDILSYKHIKYTDCSKEDIEEIEEEVLIGLITYRPLASIIKPYSENVMCLGYDNVNKECLVIDLESEELEVIGNIYENPELLK